MNTDPARPVQFEPGDWVPPWMEFHFVARLALLVHATTTVALAWWAPGSLTARLIATGDGSANLVLWAMSAVAIAGLVDAIVNDVLPARFHLPWAQRNRHLGYMTLGAVYFIQAYAGLEHLPAGAGILIANYVASGATCGAFAFSAALRPNHAL